MNLRTANLMCHLHSSCSQILYLTTFSLPEITSIIRTILMILLDIIILQGPVYRVIHKSVKHFKNSQQIDLSTDHGISYADRERN